jgi:hypothetical protein
MHTPETQPTDNTSYDYSTTGLACWPKAHQLDRWSPQYQCSLAVFRASVYLGYSIDIDILGFNWPLFLAARSVAP